MNLNKVFVLGRVTVDPQVRQTPGGASVSSFGVATNRVWTDKAGAKKEEVEFHNIVVWGRQAEIAGQFLTKGSLVLVEGRLQTRSWVDKQNQQRKTTEIIAERIQLGPRPAGQGGTWGPKGQSSQQSPVSSGHSSPASSSSSSPTVEEIPTIDIDEPGAGEIKPEDLPF